MINIAAIDLGISAVKVVFAEKKKDHFHNIQTFKTNYNSTVLNNKKATLADCQNFYYDNQDRIVEVLKETKALLPENTQYLITINSLNADIYYKRIPAKNQKRLDIAAGFYVDAAKKQDFATSYNIINFDKKQQEGEIFVYSYKANLLNDFLGIIEDSGISPDVVEFDTVALVNSFDKSLNENDYKLLINVGFSKTIFILMKNKKLEKISIAKFGANTVYNKVTNFVRTPIINVQSNFISGKNFEDYAGIQYDSLFKNLIINIKNEIDDMKIEGFPNIVLDGGFSANTHFQNIMTRFFDSNKIEILDPFSNEFEDFHNQFSKQEFSIAIGLLLR